MDSGTHISPHIDPRDLARSVPIRQLLRNLGICVHGSKRANCPLCKGGSAGTLAFNERQWFCHRCNEGGDVFSLAQAVRKSDFRDALKFVAGLAGVTLDNRRSPDFHRELAARQGESERVEAAAVKIEVLERELRLDVCRRIHFAERQRVQASAHLAQLGCQASGTEVERLWARLEGATAWLERDLLVYGLLSFGSVAERARFVIRADQRNEMIRSVHLAGGLRDDAARWIEVLQ